MKLYNFLIPLIILAVMAGTGIVSHYFLGDDNAVEEATEEIIENQIEDTFKLPKNSLDIDFTPYTPENA